MKYKYCCNGNYEDFASGRVLYQPNFKVVNQGIAGSMFEVPYDGALAYKKLFR